MSDEDQFDVFLCHNSKDKPEVIEIANELTRQGIKPWLDKWELRPGLAWQSLLEEQIENIKSAAVFVGSSGLGPWQSQEMRAFLNEFVERGCPVIPVLLGNTPQQPKLPIFLRVNTWVDFRTDIEAMENLIWGITGRKPKLQQVIQVDYLSSEKGVNYTRLRDLLAAGKWKEADEETLAVMLKASSREEEGWFDTESIKNFPCTDLRTIDQLWIQHSNGRFGFSVQKKIYLECGGKADGEYDEEAWGKFGDRVGWKVKGNSTENMDVLGDTSASEGNLPFTLRWDLPLDGSRLTSYTEIFFFRIKNCEV
ncbi:MULTISPECIES: GUN4 domain-containing protein [unclassified Nostoc]|uniref:GUN4 domain-containing protein n=1 Tax=unclassified Nostoc TaxID=2593658 RepID=UPI0013D86A02|nr:MULTISPECIES: GUN4 domain-containing protein [unclassified Nostoc]MBE8998504.1 GUN4 domain-containing protein [Nostoc sp. LEGE 12447]NEU78648.1 TIR domain-containing protein [Nostoc sp. UIC 10630]